jgi:hypothetical protein
MEIETALSLIERIGQQRLDSLAQEWDAIGQALKVLSASIEELKQVRANPKVEEEDIDVQ